VKEKLLEAFNLPENLEKQLEKAKEKNRLKDDVYIEALQDQHPEYSDEIEQIALKARRNASMDIEEFFQGTDKENKSQVAHRYAEYQIHQADTIPVLIDDKTLFFRYNKDSKTWREISLKIIHKEMDRDLSQDPINMSVTQHVHNEFQSKMKNNGFFVEWSNFGLREDQLLLKNGMIMDLESPEGELGKDMRPAAKDDYALNAVNAVYEEHAYEKYSGNALDDFICSTIPDDGERRAFQQFLGNCLMSPSDDFESALLILGPTDSGKSTLLKVVKHFFNESNTSTISFPQIGQKNAHHVDELKQSVLNFDHDMAMKNIEAKHRIKKAVSKEEIYADPKHADGYTINPIANFMIASNHPPDMQDADDAFFNRFVTIEAPETVSDKDKDRNLLDKVTSDKCMNWLLSWALEGYEDLKVSGCFAVNRDARETKEFWSKYGDTVDRFINELVSRGTEDSKNVATADVFECYEQWCRDNFEDPEARQTFTKRASDHPIMTKKRAIPFDGVNRRQCFVDIEVDMPL